MSTLIWFILHYFFHEKEKNPIKNNIDKKCLISTTFTSIAILLTPYLFALKINGFRARNAVAITHNEGVDTTFGHWSMLFCLAQSPYSSDLWNYVVIWLISKYTLDNVLQIDYERKIVITNFHLKLKQEKRKLSQRKKCAGENKNINLQKTCKKYTSSG